MRVLKRKRFERRVLLLWRMLRRRPTGGWLAPVERCGELLVSVIQLFIGM